MCTSIKWVVIAAVAGLGLAALVCVRPHLAWAQQAPGAAAAPEKHRAEIASDERMTEGAWKQRHEAIVARVHQGPVGMIFIGDSITHFWENDGANAIWNQFYARRGAVNMGISGDRTQHVLWRLENGEIDGIKPKVAVVLIGTNNCWGDEVPVDATARAIKQIVEKLRKKLPQTKVLLLGILPRDETPSAMRGKLLQVNQIISRLDDGKFVHYLDIGKFFVDENGRIAKEIMPDALHLSLQGYRIWAEAMEPKLAQLLGERPAGRP